MVVHLSLHRGFLLVEKDRAEVGRVALDDIHALIVHAHGVTWTGNIVAALAERGAPIVFCNAAHAPVAVTLPLDGHHAQNARMQAQIAASPAKTRTNWRCSSFVRNLEPPRCADFLFSINKLSAHQG